MQMHAGGNQKEYDLLVDLVTVPLSPDGLGKSLIGGFFSNQKLGLPLRNVSNLRR